MGTAGTPGRTAGPAGGSLIMKIAGVSVIRDEADIVRISILHHLAIGCHEIRVVDNGSSDRTPEILRKLSRRHPVLWTRDEGPFRQSETITELAREAARNGADWIVPFDADEFWWPAQGGLEGVLSASSAPVLRAPVVNFVQRRRQHRSTPGALALMTWRAQPAGSTASARELVEGKQIAFVEIDYPPKHVARAAATITIAKGNHEISGVPGHIESTRILHCLHAPLRSRAVLEAKAATAARVQEENPHPESAWQTKRWGRLAAAGLLAEEWAANSQTRGTLDVYGTKRRLVFDTTLRGVVWPWLLFPQRLLGRVLSLPRG
jgi:hypothetical protein